MRTKTVGLVFAAVILVSALAVSKTPSQSEIAPDHFESPNTEPFSRPKAIVQSPMGGVRYDGEFTLRYPVQCRGKTIAPGKYTLSLQADGKTGRATIASKSEKLEIAGVVHALPSEKSRAAVIVGSKHGARVLCAIELALLQLALDSDYDVAHLASAKLLRLERLPLIAITVGNQPRSSGTH